MSALAIVAGSLAAYLVPLLVLWRRKAAAEWAVVERGLKLRERLVIEHRYPFSDPDPEGRRAAQAEVDRIRRGKREYYALWLDNPYDDPPGRGVVALQALALAVAWPLLVGYAVMARAGAHVAVAVTNPTRTERKRRQLTAARESVARLERDLGIGEGA